MSLCFCLAGLSKALPPVKRRTRTLEIKSRRVAVRERFACATQLFTEGLRRHHGQEIVAAAGVSKPVLYYYFQNKRHLPGADPWRFRETRCALEASRSERNAIEKLLRLCDRFFPFEGKISVTHVLHLLWTREGRSSTSIPTMSSS
jgi:hypothetical protein